MENNKLEKLRKMLQQVGANPNDLTSTGSLENMTGLPGGARLDVGRVETAKQIELEFAAESLDSLLQGRIEDLDSDGQESLEAIVMPRYRPVIDIIDGQIETRQLTKTWRHLGTDEPRKRIIESTFSSIGRIDIPNHPTLPYAGTGFLVGKSSNGRGNLMTNRHVAEIFSAGIGVQNLKFFPGQTVAIDFLREHTRKDAYDSLTVEKVLMIHPYWDMALLQVVGLAEEREPLKLSVADPASLQEAEVCTVGYPGYDMTDDPYFQNLQNRIFRNVYYVKRFQPGRLKVREKIASYSREVLAITHDCSTLGGNSGSAVLKLPQSPDDSIEVIGLHFAGDYLHANYAVSTYDLASDSSVVDTGINFSGDLPPSNNQYEAYWSKIHSEGPASNTTPASSSVLTQAPSSPVNKPSQSDSKTATWKIPLEVSVTFDTPELSAATSSSVQASISPTVGNAALSSSTANAARASIAPEEGLFGSQPEFTLSELAKMFSLESLAAKEFGWPTALSLAVASKLVYENQGVVEDTATTDWGLDSCKFVDFRDTQCFIASFSDNVLIAFRGTKELRDWLTNLNIFSDLKDYGSVHRGFYYGFDDVKKLLKKELKHLSPNTVLLTGHSLGGALATIAAAEWNGIYPITGIYTYGQPAVGKRDFSTFFSSYYGNEFFRFVNDDDIVTRVPATYQHVGQLFHFDAQGELKKVRTEAITAGASGIGLEMMSKGDFFDFQAQLLMQKARENSATFTTESLGGPVPEGLIPSVSDHNLSEYIRKIRAEFNRDRSIRT